MAELPDDEREAAWERIEAVAPHFARYREQTARVIPIFELRRGSP